MPRQLKTGKEPIKSTSFRLNEQQKFALKLMARINGVSDSDALGNIIEEAAKMLPISRHYLDLYDEEESVRMLNLFALLDFKPSKASEEEERQQRAFCVAHGQFFWTDASRSTPRRAFAVTLWPHLNELVELWKTRRDEDYWVAAKAMAAILKKAKLDPPPFG